jgi:hypothetical protein
VGYASATTGQTYGVSGRTDSSSGAGVYGWAAATSGDSGIGVLGQNSSTSGYGVAGLQNGYGISDLESHRGSGGNFGGYDGVIGFSKEAGGSGVIGDSRSTAGSGYGVYGYSSSPNGTGVEGNALNFGARGSASATTGINYGVYGVSGSDSGRGVLGSASATTGINYGVYGASGSDSGVGVYGWAGATTGVNYGVVGSTWSPSGYGVISYGDMHAEGDFTATGTKSAIVNAGQYGWRNLYAMESPQNWFEDFGRASLSSGEVVVPIEPIFAKTVNLEEPYHVFLTPLGNCSLYVEDMSPVSFTVRAQEGADCGITFDYRIIALRSDYEDLRLTEAEDPHAMEASLSAAQAAP